MTEGIPSNASSGWRIGHERVERFRRPLLWILLGLAVFLRLRAYLFDRSLWLDEAMLALNITKRSFGMLLQPLEYHQAAPVGFLFLERSAVILLGGSEYVLRLFPLLAGVASVLLFWKLAEAVLSPGAVFVAVGAFAVTDRLVYYASEAKQYSSDVAISLLLWWLAAKYEPEDPRGRGWIVAVVGGIAIWFSHPAIFVLAAIGLRALWVQAKRRAWGAVCISTLTGALWVASFAGTYAISLRNVSHDSGLREFWTEAAAPIPPTSLKDLMWYVDAMGRIAALPLGREVAEVVAVTGILGGVVLFAEQRNHFFRLLVPGLLALLASSFQRYPLANRLWLFMVPALLILVAAGLNGLWTKTRNAWPLVGVAVGVLLFAHPVLYAGYHVARPQQVEETRPLFQYIQQARQRGDGLYLYSGAVPAARYYSERGLIQLEDAVVGVGARRNLGKYVESLEALRGKGRVWIVFAHVNVERGLNEEELTVLSLDRIAKRLMEQRRHGASLYLYDLGR